MIYRQMIAFISLLLMMCASVAATEDMDALRNVLKNHEYALSHGENDNGAYLYGIRELARKGQRESQFLLGGFALAGMVPIKEGMQWLVKANDQGCAGAAGILGVIYMSGNGIEKNVAAGMMWINAAAKQGDPGSQMLLSEIYLNGTANQKRKPVLAYSWLLQALEHPAIIMIPMMKMDRRALVKKYHLTQEQVREAERLVKKRVRDLGGITPYLCGSSLPMQGTPTN